MTMPGTIAYTADRIFTGDHWLDHHALVAEDGHIRKLCPAAELPASIPVKDFTGCMLVPSFIDLQIYGAGGRLFSVYPDSQSLHGLKAYCEGGGAALCMPTVATNTSEVFYRCIDAIRSYWDEGGEGIMGLHLEGPWINPLKRGAHIESLIEVPTLADARELLEYGKGIIKMITLAPERVSPGIIDLIRSYGIVISAGHSNACYTEAIHAFDHGITTVTHLFNAMSPLQHREPGLAGATMDHTRVCSSIIPDGFHVDYAALRIAKKVMKERLFVITDAVTETQQGAYQHYPAGDKYEAAGILSGSALTMDKALQNLLYHASIELDEALRMCSLYPARVIGIDTEAGRLETGYRSLLTVLDPSFKTVTVIR